MSPELKDLVIFLALVGVIAAVGVWLGIFFLAPRLTRLADRHDEDTGDPTD